MVEVVLGFLLLIIGILLIIKKRFIEFAVFWMIVASSSDSCGFVLFIQQSFSSYAYLMDMELILCAFLSLQRYLKIGNRFYSKWIGFIVVSGVLIVFSFMISGITGFGVYRIIHVFSSWCPLLVLIIICNADEYSSKGKSLIKTFIMFVYFQVTVAFLITYLPTINIHFLDVFCGANYISDGYIYNKRIFTISEIHNALVSKYYFNGLGQFHNGNDMGFYGIIGIIMAVYSVLNYKKNVINVLGAVLVVYMSICLWGNSGMRGPIVGAAIGIVFAILCLKKRSKIIWIIVLIAIAGVLLCSKFGEDIISYVFPSTSNISYTGREELRSRGIKYISKYPLFGAGGRLSDLIDEGIDPHELPLRYACLLGIPMGILMMYFYAIKPVLFFLKKRKDSVSIVLFFVLLFVAFTNNYTDMGLFEFAFSVVIVRMCEISCCSFKGVLYEKNINLYR